MCRSIKRLRTIEGVAGEDEIRAAARQFVRKVSGVNEPTAKNSDAFESAVEAVSRASLQLLVSLPPSGSPLFQMRPRLS